ncbi:MAG: hypothetical protein V5B39_22010 [Accumulibacter sp.]|jgi:hypothetical protein|uniref:hypothetical protein n=1 Tax=Accumulibacter sp. TaxID=2053492 RepID=UPI002FC28253
MDTPQAQIIEQEIHDLSGLLCDLYRRVAESAPERAGEIAGALQANARQFAEIPSGTH